MAKIILSFKVLDYETQKPNYLMLALEGDVALVPYSLDGPNSLDGSSPGEIMSVELQYERHLLKWEPELTTHIITPKGDSDS